MVKDRRSCSNETFDVKPSVIWCAMPGRKWICKYPSATEPSWWTTLFIIDVEGLKMGWGTHLKKTGKDEFINELQLCTKSYPLPKKSRIEAKRDAFWNVLAGWPGERAPSDVILSSGYDFASSTASSVSHYSIFVSSEMSIFEKVTIASYMCFTE